jgi:catechol 2,3-dioxygenase-like lactoylglutathione lyase family enzyme
MSYSRSVFATWFLLAGALTASGPLPRSSIAAEPLPIDRLAMVTFRGADLEKTRKFYGDVMGFEVVRETKDDSGQLRGLTFKVNDDQFLAFFGGGPAEDGGAFRLERIALLTPDIGRAREWVAAHRLAPGAIEKKDDGNPHFSLADPDGTTIDFVEYQADSWQAGLRGNGLGPRRVSDHLQHAGLVVADEPAAMALYRDKLGFRERNRGGPTPGETRWIVIDMPGTKGDFVEFMVHRPDPPERRQHICLGVPDIDRTYQALLDAGVQQKFKPFVTPSGLHLMNVRDPNGLRVEFWEEKPEPKKE